MAERELTRTGVRPAMATPPEIVRLKISLDALKSTVMRRIEVPVDVKLDTLHEMIQVIMPWGNYHPYEFRIRDRHWRIPCPEIDDYYEIDVRDARKTTLARVLAEPNFKTLRYTYDFGDDCSTRSRSSGTSPRSCGTSFRVSSMPRGAVHLRTSAARGATVSTWPQYPIHITRAMPSGSSGLAATIPTRSTALQWRRLWHVSSNLLGGRHAARRKRGLHEWQGWQRKRRASGAQCEASGADVERRQDQTRQRRSRWLGRFDQGPARAQPRQSR